MYKTHVWRCNGICQHRKPFYGYVRRTANRIPGPSDMWWMQHQTSCGGYFQKISAPEPKQKARSANATAKQPPSKQPAPVNQPKINSGRWGFNRNATVTVTSTPKANNYNAKVPSQLTKSLGNLTNVVGFKDLTGDSPSNDLPVTQGRGQVLCGFDTITYTPKSKAIGQSVRDHWNKRFADQRTLSPPPVEPAKRPKILQAAATSKWETLDDDIQVRSDRPSMILINDSDDEDCNLDISNSASAVTAKMMNNESKPSLQPTKQSSGERQSAIKQEILHSINETNIAGEEDESDIELIDDDFDDDLRDFSFVLTDNRVIDDIFGADTLMADFNEINDVIMSDAENQGQPNKEIIMCPICQERMQREQLVEHLDGCLGITINVPLKAAVAAPSSVRARRPPSAVAATSSAVKSDLQVLQECGYDAATITKVLRDKSEEKAYNKRILAEMASEPAATATTSRAQTSSIVADKVPCPVCQGEIDSDKINDHLDVCLTNGPELE